jgi:hypothetical protein
MRKFTTSLFFAALALVLTTTANATVVDLTSFDNADVLADTLDGIADGDTVLLKPGMTYNAGGFKFDKSVLIESADPLNFDRPKIHLGGNYDLADGSTIGFIIFRNIELLFDHSGDKYVINATGGATIGKLEFDGCYLHTMRGILRMKAESGTVDEFIINNTVVEMLGNYGVLTVDTDTWAVNHIKLMNSSFSKAEAFITSRNNTTSVVIDGCTISEIPAAGQRMFRWRTSGQDNVTEGISISNTLWGTGWDKAEEGTTAYDGFDGLGETTWTFDNVYITSDLDIADGKDSIVGVDNVYAGTSTELWADLANSNFNYADAAFAGIGNAGDQRWGVATDDGGVEMNISHPAFATLGTLDSTQKVAALTIYAHEGKTVTIDDNNKTVGEMSFTQRLKLGGSGDFNDDGSPAGRVLLLELDHASAITVAAMSSSSSSDRVLNVAAGNKDNLIGEHTALGGELTMSSFNYYGGPTTIMMYSPSSGVNVYYVKVADINNTDAKLSALSVDEGTMDPPFDPDVTTYAVDVPYGTSSVTVSATPNDPNATVVGDSAIDVSSGSASVDVVVTAEDGTTMMTYTISFTVQEPEKASITFIVDDTDGGNATGFGLKGSWDTSTGVYDAAWSNGAEHSPFYDDGTNGDETAGDHIWTVTLELTPDGGTNTWEWGVNDSDGNWIDGNFQFTVTDATDQTLDPFVFVGIKNLRLKASVYPTVSNGIFNVEFEGKPGTITVYSITGSKVLTRKASSSMETINLNQEGVYLFRVETEEEIQTVRVVCVR